MAWTTPKTWAAAELVTAALLNTHLRDNLNELVRTDTAVPKTDGVESLGTSTLSWNDLFVFKIKDEAGNTVFDTSAAGVNYTLTATVVEDRTLLASASATTINNNNVLAALIQDLIAIGILT